MKQPEYQMIQASINNTEEPFVQCKNYEICNLCGPWDDPTGEKWNEMVVNIRVGMMLQMGVQIRKTLSGKYEIKLPSPEENIWRDGFVELEDAVHYGWMRMKEWRHK